MNQQEYTVDVEYSRDVEDAGDAGSCVLFLMLGGKCVGHAFGFIREGQMIRCDVDTDGLYASPSTPETVRAIRAAF